MILNGGGGYNMMLERVIKRLQRKVHLSLRFQIFQSQTQNFKNGLNGSSDTSIDVESCEEHEYMKIKGHFSLRKKLSRVEISATGVPRSGHVGMILECGECRRIRLESVLK
ncbi:unnamed protein product [Meloidogyne enterolobii]|uniref:Uncharacterized protein n=1 Tax=Meloidogyne enterolobii TaxID=390850 RepID=A0ACB0YWZ7_MELEN